MLFLLVLIVGATGAAGFFFGTSYGRSAETKVVATALAEYRQLDVASGIAVNRVLGKLKREYRDAFNAVVDEIDQTRIAASRFNGFKL